MITDMRKGLKTYGVKIVLWIVIISMVLGYAVFRHEDHTQRSFLKINGRDISRSYFEQRLYQENQRIQQLRERLGGEQADIYLNMLGLSNPKMLAFSDIVRQTVLNSIAEQMRIDISESFIIDKLQNPGMMLSNLIDIIPVYVFDPTTGRINENKLQQYLRYTGQSMSEFEENIENIFKRALVSNLATVSNYVLPQEARAYFNEHYTPKKFEVLNFSLDTFKKNIQQNVITTEQLKEFFDVQNQRQKRYFLPEKRSGVLYVFNPEEYNISIKNPDIAAYYSAHRASFVKKPAQAQLRKMVFKINADYTAEQIQKVQDLAKTVLQDLKVNPTPTQFETLARKHSQDTKTASAGGLVPVFGRGELDPALETAFFKLRKDGDVSDLVTTQEGIEIIQRVSRTPVVYKTLEEATDDIIALIKNQEFKKQFTQDATKAIRQAKANGTQDLIQKKHAKEEKIDHLEKDQSIKAERLFKMRQGDWGYYFEGNKGILIQLQEIHKSQPPAFDAAQNQVKADFVTAKAKEAMRKNIEQAQKEADHQSLKDIAARVGAKLENIDFVAGTDTERIDQLQKQGFPVQKMLSLAIPGAKALVIEDHHGYLIKCLEAKPFNQDLFEKEKKNIIQELYKEQKPLIEGGFVASLFRNAKINSVDPELNISSER